MTAKRIDDDPLARALFDVAKKAYAPHIEKGLLEAKEINGYGVIAPTQKLKKTLEFTAED